MSDTLFLILFGPTVFIFAVSFGFSLLFFIKHIIDWIDEGYRKYAYKNKV